jgi:hypothetical protein
MNFVHDSLILQIIQLHFSLCWISMAPLEHTIQVSENYCPFFITCKDNSTNWEGCITYGVCTCCLFLKNERDVVPTYYKCKISTTLTPHDLHILSSLTHLSHSLQQVKPKGPKTWCKI